MQNRPAHNYFSFTRKERNGTIFLVMIILFLTALPHIYPFFIKEKLIDAVDLQEELALLRSKQIDSAGKKISNTSGENNYARRYSPLEKNRQANITGELFQFDPNTLDVDGWKRLGIRDKTINTIRNFISKGGKFRQPGDIKKIWGLHENEIQRLLPYIKIDRVDQPVTYTPREYPVNKYESKSSFEPVEINLADTNALISLRGIGSKLANRIINFREKLGGFYEVEQVAETFGLPDSVYRKIKPQLVLADKRLRQININTATVEELKMHPYIRYKLAEVIVQYRLQHGNFINVNDLRKIMILNDTLYAKISPYISVR